MTSETTASARTAAARSSRLGARTWSTIIALGLIGQLAWAVENMYLNVFVYETISTDPNVIALLVASSAIAATLATMLIGALSDRVGKRKPFIVIGYIAWGLLTASFGLVGVDGGSAAATTQAVGAAIVAIVALDCVMSVFGSGANDGAFNAWVTESTTPSNRGRVDGVLAIMPLIAMLIIFGGFDSLTKAGEWKLFFANIGALTALAGVAALFFMREAPHIELAPGAYFASVVAGLRPSHVRAHPRLYVTLLAGDRWTDGTGSTENSFLVGTKVHKIHEKLSWRYGLDNWADPWRITGGGLDATLTPFYNKRSAMNFGVVANRTDQCFGYWSGSFDTGDEVVTFDGIVGFAEDVDNRW